MPVCKFFLQGRCQRGTECRFEHPESHQVAGSPRGQSRQRNPSYSDLEDQFHQSGDTLGQTQQSWKRNQPQRNFNQDSQAIVSEGAKNTQNSANIRPEDVIYHDLAQIKIQWPLSCYGLNLSWDNGDNIIHGDFSPEELRCEAYAQSRTFGNINTYQRTLAQALQQKQFEIVEIIKNPQHGVVLGRTPRTLHSNRHATFGKPLNTTLEISQAPVINTMSSTRVQEQRNLELESFSFGSIPEIPPL